MESPARNNPEPGASDGTALPWRSLRLFNFYRLFVYLLFFAMALATRFATPWPLLPTHSLSLLLGVSGVMLGMTVLATAAVRRRWPPFHVQAPAYVFSDILAITLILHALGGTGSGAGVLLVASVAAGALLLPARAALAFAAIASLAILGERVHSELNDLVSIGTYTQAGLLGVACFATTLLGAMFARRARESERLAEQRGADLADMAQLNELIIRRMRSGVVVIDPRGDILTMNESAWYLMGMPSPGERALAKASPQLAETLDLWQQGQRADSEAMRLSEDVPAVVPHFSPLGRGRDSGTLITLEDSSTVEQRAQQMNLASLGRLTANIAHEIRNPLGAIGHAGQLLAESPDMTDADQRLTEIIRTHTWRVNQVVENVLQLSRRTDRDPGELVLDLWLRHFVEDFCRDFPLEPARIRVDIRVPDIRITADRYQLHQLVWNLCSNASRYSLENGEDPSITLRVNRSPESHRPFLEVVDRGPGVEPSQAEQIFEPFYTSDSAGSGLGLYIARQLAESNQARLRYQPEPGGGSCFRISFYAAAAEFLDATNTPAVGSAEGGTSR